MTKYIVFGAGLISLGFISFVIGFNLAEKSYQKIAIDEGYAYFHPVTARFTWVDQDLNN